MKRTQRKDATRNIRKKIVSFLSIFLIAGLGVGAFLSTSHLSNTIRHNAAEYYDATNYRDATMISSQGIRPADFDEIRATPGVCDAEGAVELTGTVFSESSGCDVDIVTVTERIALPVVREGRLPELAGECGMDRDTADALGITVGDRVRLAASDELIPNALSEETFTVTAIVEHPIFMRRGMNRYILIPYAAINKDASGGLYTHAYVRYETPEDSDRFSKEYADASAPVDGRLSVLGTVLGIARDEDNRRTADTMLADAEREMNETLGEAEREIAENEAKLEEARADGLKQLARGEQTLYAELATALSEIEAGEKTLREEIEKAEAEIAAGEAEAAEQLAAGEAELEEAERRYEEGASKLAEGEAEYEEGVNTYNTEIADAEAKLADAAREIRSYQSQLNAAVSSLNSRIDAKVAEVDATIGEADGIVTTLETRLTAEADKLGTLAEKAGSALDKADTAAGMLSLILRFSSASDIVQGAVSTATDYVNGVLLSSQDAYNIAYAAAGYLNAFSTSEYGQTALEAASNGLVDSVNDLIGSLNDLTAHITDADLAPYKSAVLSALSDVRTRVNTVKSLANSLLDEVGPLFEALPPELSAVRELAEKAESVATVAETAVNIATVTVMFTSPSDAIRAAVLTATTAVSGALSEAEEIRDIADDIETYLTLILFVGRYGDLASNARLLVSAAEGLVDSLNDVAANIDSADLEPYRLSLIDAADGVCSEIRSVKTLADTVQSEITNVRGSVHDNIQTIRTDVTDRWTDAKTVIQSKYGTDKASECIRRINSLLNTYTADVPAAVRSLKPLSDLETDIRNALAELVSAVAQIDDAQSRINDGRAELAAAEETFRSEKAAAEEKLAAAEAELSQGRAELEEGRLAIEQGRADLEAARIEAEQKLADARAELEQAKVDGERQLADARAEYEKGRADGLRRLREARAAFDSEIAEAEQKLADGKAEYASGKADAERELSDAKEQALDIPNCNWLVRTSSLDTGLILVRLNIETTLGIGIVITSVFLLIAVLVTFSTITILINEQSKLVGSMKANGFLNREIEGKYLLFAVLAALLGAVFAYFLSLILGRVMLNIYSPMFLFDFEHLFVSPVFVIGAFAAILLLAVLAAHFAARRLLSAPAGQLMSGTADLNRKRARKSGSNTAGGSLYSRLILRNMASEPARIAISVVIIAASCIVVGASITINDSFQNMIRDQLDQIVLYDYSVTSDGNLAEEDIDRIRSAVTGAGGVMTSLRNETHVVLKEDVQSAFSVFVSSGSELKGLIGIRPEMNAAELPIPDRGILIDERMGETLGVSEGDTITLLDGSLGAHEAVVEGTFLNLQGNYAIMSDAYYEEVFGETALPNTVFVRSNGDDPERILSALNGLSDRYTIERADKFAEEYESLSDMFRFVVIILLAVAMIMTFLVLTNLVNIFVNGKKRELIIMRVNGFSKKQGIGYLIRETVLTTGIGLLAGFALGVPFAAIAVRNISAETYTLVPHFIPRAWIVALGVEALFALLINAVAFRKVTHLDLKDITKA